MSTATGVVVIINNKEDFEKLLEESGNKIVLIEFYAEWCGPCKLIKKKLDEWAKTFSDKAVIVRIDVDELEEVAMDYNVTSMPTFLFIQNKKQINSAVGSKAGEKVETLLHTLCNRRSSGAGRPSVAGGASTSKKSSIALSKPNDATTKAAETNRRGSAIPPNQQRPVLQATPSTADRPAPAGARNRQERVREPKKRAL